MNRRSAKLAAVEGEAEVRSALVALAAIEGVRGLAKRLRMSPGGLSRVLNKQSNVTAKLAKAVGYEKVVVFRKRQGQ